MLGNHHHWILDQNGVLRPGYKKKEYVFSIACIAGLLSLWIQVRCILGDEPQAVSIPSETACG